MAEEKSLCKTYFLWLIGGFFGLHHFYLGRDRHAFVSWMSFGCYFGTGWFRDLWRIPEYVKDRNEDKEYIQELTLQMRKVPKPPSSIVRHCGTIIIADILGYLVIGALPVDYLPEKSLPYFCALLAPMGAAIGVHLVGNIGRHEGSFWWPFLGAYMTSPMYYITTNSVFWSSMCSAYFFNKFAKKWRRTPPKPKSGALKRILILTLCGLLYLSLWSSWLYFNCSVVDRDEQETKCRDAARNFFQSPIWKEFSTVFGDLWRYAQHHGWSGIWRELVDAMDPQGEVNAIKTLNLKSTATQEEITVQYKKLARQWHPDRHKLDEDKKAAQEKFIEIQQAYEILSRIKDKRMRRNRRERDNPIEPSVGTREETREDL